MASSGQALALSRAIVAATRAPHCSNAHTDFLASQQQRLESVYHQEEKRIFHNLISDTSPVVLHFIRLRAGFCF